ncbi:MAG: nucleotide exchange factor GrpE, partial [Gemmatimonadales bacterium]
SSRTEDTQPRFLGGADSRLEEDLAELKDRHLRLAAEYDNYRKRSSRERAELADRAQASFVAKLLDVLDDLDRLVASDPSTPLASLREGLSAVDRKLWKELQDAGVERIDPVGTAFDPALHEAVSTTPAPERSKEQVVSATFQPGVGSSQKPGLGVLSSGRRLRAHIGRGDIAAVGAAAGIALRLSHSGWSVDGASVAIDIASKSTLFCHFTRSLSRYTKDNI